MKEKDTDRMFQRILKILEILSYGENPTLKELAEQFKVDVRTIRRDITQRLSFFPVSISNGVVYMAEGFSFPRSGLKENELLTAELAFSAIHGMNENIDEQLRTIRAKLSYPLLVSPYHVKAELFEKINLDRSILNKIEDAIIKKNVSKITSNEMITVVEPYKVVAFDGIWYLFAKDLGDGKIKTYLISHIRQFRASLEVYESDQAMILRMLNNVHTAWFEDGNSFEVMIKVMPEVAHYFKIKQHLSSQVIKKEHKDGALTITFQISTDEDVDNLIKAWLPHIEVLKPERFRKRLLNELKHYVTMLQKPELGI